MRFCPLLMSLILSGTVVAQDATQQILQLQQQQTLQLQQQQLQQQLTQQQLDLINQQQLALGADASLAGYRLGVRSPRMRQKTGAEPGTVVVHMEDPSRGASIFYTTDGWTPTAASNRYAGPITIRSKVTMRAIAIVAGGLRSYVSVLPITPTPVAPVIQAPSSVRVQQLSSGIILPLMFSASVSSRSVKIGDQLPVLLAEDLFFGGKLAAPKGSPVEAVVTQVDNSHVQGLPGVLSFSVRSIRLQDGTTVSLLGVETMEGADHTKKAEVASIIPLGGLTVHGGDAIIPVGARFEAEIKDSFSQSTRLDSRR